MEGRKENKYNLSGICPQCGKLLKVEIVVATELVDTGTTTETEGKDNAGRQTTETVPDGNEESGSVRPADTERKIGTASADDQPAYTKKGGRNKNTGGDKVK